MYIANAVIPRSVRLIEEDRCVKYMKYYAVISRFVHVTEKNRCVKQRLNDQRKLRSGSEWRYGSRTYYVYVSKARIRVTLASSRSIELGERASRSLRFIGLT